MNVISRVEINTMEVGVSPLIRAYNEGQRYLQEFLDSVSESQLNLIFLSLRSKAHSLIQNPEVASSYMETDDIEYKELIKLLVSHPRTRFATIVHCIASLASLSFTGNKRSVSIHSD